MFDVFNIFKVSAAFWKQSMLTLGASMAFLVIGLVRGYSSSALPSMEAIDPHLITSSEQKSWIGSVAPLGAFCGSLLSGPLMARAGRKRTLQLTAPLWAGAWALLGLATNLAMLIVARIMCGLGVGLTLASVQVYVSECCDAEVRGRLGSMPTFFMSFGILLSYILGNWLAWRQLAFVCCGISVLLFVMLLPLPESPVWLDSMGLDPSASQKWLHLAPVEPTHAPERPAKEKELEDQQDVPSLFTREVFCSSVVLKPLVICLGLLFLQQLSGIDSVIFFTVEIFHNAGSTLDPSTATIIVGLVQLLCNGVSTVLLDRSGRKPLLLVSSAITAVSMVAMGIAFFYDSLESPILGYLPIASLVLFMVGFSLGLGGVPFLLLGELFPAHHRSQLSALAGAVNLLTMFAVLKSFHMLERLLSSAITFWLYASCCAAAFVFTLTMVPETKGKTLAQIEQHFRSQNKDNKQKKPSPTEQKYNKDNKIEAINEKKSQSQAEHEDQNKKEEAVNEEKSKH